MGAATFFVSSYLFDIFAVDKDINAGLLRKAPALLQGQSWGHQGLNGSLWDCVVD